MRVKDLFEIETLFQPQLSNNGEWLAYGYKKPLLKENRNDTTFFYISTKGGEAKRVLPENIVFTYQGDGDLAAIGTSEIIHAANRGEKITVIFVNNGVYGMTGGQMAPTTMINQKTATSLRGRKLERDGFPLKISEMLSVLPGVKYIERTSIHNQDNIRKTKEAIKKAFNIQIENRGFSMVEVISACPIYGAKSIKDAYKKIEEEIIKFYPLGVLKDAD